MKGRKIREIYPETMELVEEAKGVTVPTPRNDTGFINQLLVEAAQARIDAAPAPKKSPPGEKPPSSGEPVGNLFDEAKFAACKGLHSLGQGRDALDVWHAYGDETAETAIADLEKAIQDASAKPS